LTVVDLLRGPSPAGAHRAAGSEPFEAVAVERADAVERVRGAVVRDAHVAELRMREPVHELLADHGPAADAGADGHVAEGVQPDGRAPALLAERRRVHVRVERDLHAERRAQRADDVRVGPPRLRSRRDQAAAKVDRPERAEAERSGRAVAGEELDRAADRLVGRRRRDRRELAQVVRPCAECADPLRPAGLDAAVRHALRGCAITVRNGWKRDAYSSTMSSASETGTAP
jgi:hypothetical protein